MPETVSVSSFNERATSSYFFFSSRRRHTRCSRDWSSDVCSSDLPCGSPLALELLQHRDRRVALRDALLALLGGRSEERRVGKECKSLRLADHYTQNL